MDLRKLMFWQRRSVEAGERERVALEVVLPPPVVTEQDRAEREAFRVDLHTKMERADEAIRVAMDESSVVFRTPYRGPDRRRAKR